MADIPTTKKARRPGYPKTRVKTGCLTCRRRKIKCDETRPSCLRCQAAAFTCDGYPARGPHRLGRDSPSASPNPLALVLPAGTAFRSGDEHQSISFYLTVTASKLAGPFGSSFWSHYLPQISQADPAVHHALVALGSFHRGLDVAPSASVSKLDSRYRQVTLEHYNKAMRALQNHMSREDGHSIRVVLISSLLFTLLECLMGNYETGALMHLRSGLDILGNWRIAKARKKQAAPPSSFDSATVEEQLVRLFSELELQSAFLLGARKEEEPGAGRRHRLGLPSTSPAVFTGLREAKYALEAELSIVHDYYQWSIPVKYSRTPEGDQELRQRYREVNARFEHWSAAFRQFLSVSQRNMSRDQLLGAVQLKIKQKLVRILLETSLLLPEELDRLTPDYEAMMSMIRSLTGRILEGTETSTGNSPPKPPHSFDYSVDASIVMPLAFTMTACVDLSLRLEAMEILSRYPRREGFWDSAITSKLARQNMKYEVSKLSYTGKVVVIPNGPRRVTVENISPDEGRGILQIQSGLQGDTAQVTREWIEW